MPLPCWVTAEIGELKVNYSGHCYMELVEKGGDNGIPCAKASAVIWRNRFGMVSSYFRSETGAELSAGMNVLVKVSVSYHELYGLSLVVSDIDPLYTLGDLERQRQKTIARLQEEGVYDMNRGLPFPGVPQRIAVVSSRNAAGYQDFMNELGRSPFGFRVELFDAFMQGHGTEDSVIDALGRICERLDDFDTVIIIRGGGSQSDLAAFDSYRLCCHIAQFPLPVVTGIGHDKDESIADLVAAVALKTPTAVAGFLVESMQSVDAWLVAARGDILRLAVGMLENESRTLREAGFRLARTSSGLTRTVDIRLERLIAGIRRMSEQTMASLHYRLDVLDGKVRNRSQAIITAETAKTESLRQLVESRDPAKILALGFAVVRSEGRPVTDAAQVSAGDLLEINLHRGVITARAEKAGEN
ncbi:MAG: exodeoxyribonuclease VII large subunit [Alistipes sp.]|nr:exodeoxyribonuclease VII large subunit [Alistipes sp.]